MIHPDAVGSSGAPPLTMSVRKSTRSNVPAPCLSRCRLYPDRVRLTHFRRLMDDEFGAVRAGSIARDHVFSRLNGRTVEQAIEAGEEPREVWRAVCTEFDVPAERR